MSALSRLLPWHLADAVKRRCRRWRAPDPAPLGPPIEQIAANPQAYGITKGLVCPPFISSTACLVDASGYLFYGDALHLTAQGYTILAHYVAAQLAAPLTLGAPGDLGLQTARQFGRTLSTRSDLYGRGGVTETVVDEVTGILFPEQTPESLVLGMQRLEASSFDPTTCRRNAERFASSEFRRRFSRVIDRQLKLNESAGAAAQVESATYMESA